MPEAPMNEYHFATRGKHKVGRSRQVFAVHAEPVSKAVDHAAKCELRTCILAADSPHIGAAAFCGKFVWHFLPLYSEVERKI